jgi:hypothetical protein
MNWLICYYLTKNASLTGLESFFNDLFRVVTEILGVVLVLVATFWYVTVVGVMRVIWIRCRLLRRHGVRGMILWGRAVGGGYARESIDGSVVRDLYVVDVVVLQVMNHGEEQVEENQREEERTKNRC